MELHGGSATRSISIATVRPPFDAKGLSCGTPDLFDRAFHAAAHGTVHPTASRARKGSAVTILAVDSVCFLISAQHILLKYMPATLPLRRGTWR